MAWIKTQRQIPRERSELPLVVAPPDEELALAAAESGWEEVSREEGKNDWAHKVPDGVLIAAAVMGACIGCPIGSAIGGVVLGFVCGLAGALVGELAVLGVARLLKLAIGVAVPAAQSILQSLVR